MELIVKKFLEEQEKQFTKAFEHIKKTFESTKRSINLTLPGFYQMWLFFSNLDSIRL